MNRPGVPRMCQLMDSYMMLFGMNRHAALEDLTANVLKKTYRKKIFQNHPDRAVVLGVARSILNERSKGITDAYEMLLQYVGKRRKPAGRTGRGKDRADAGKRGPGEKRHLDETLFSSTIINQVPDEPVSLIHFLYYLEIIDFTIVVEALTWQKTERPYIGKLARKMNFLTDSDTACIIRSRRTKELFGACAIRLGMLTSDQVKLLLAEQDARTPRIEIYLLTRAILDEKELAFVMAKLDEHNSKASIRKSA